MSWTATAPSNIALIKYMGKADPFKNPNFFSLYKNKQNVIQTFKHLSEKDKEDFYFKNISLNSSLSYTLHHFVTKVQIEDSDKDKCSPFKKNPFLDQTLYSSSKKVHFKNKLSAPVQKRFLKFFQFLKRFFFISGNYQIHSQNNFPMAIGAASSASSFAALTRAAYKLAKDRSAIKEQLNNIPAETLAEISRIGSGSSGRSFFSPWALWTIQGITPFKTSYLYLLHQLVVVDPQEKKISSTKAHDLVKTSPRFKGRSDRAKKRMKALTEAFNQPDWKKCFNICYEEFLDLHSLFETAEPPLKYKTDSSQRVLNCINDYWGKNNDGPLVTMDAGANIHLLYRTDQKEQRESIKNLLKDYVVLSSL